jgi:site-specific recombinase XerD
VTKHQDAGDHLFLSLRGIPFTAARLRTITKAIVYRYTGQCWHPHNVRTVWATEMILKGVDLGKVAKMLNDDLKTIIANYAHLLNQNVAEEVYDIIDRHLGQGK